VLVISYVRSDFQVYLRSGGLEHETKKRVLNGAHLTLILLILKLLHLNIEGKKTMNRKA
jgi:hypothetical protein